MKFNQLISWSLLSTLVTSQSIFTTIYEVNPQNLDINSPIPNLNSKDSQIYFDNLVGKDTSHSKLSLELIDLVNDQIDDVSNIQKPKLIINLAGDVDLQSKEIKPIFQTSNSLKTYFKNFKYGHKKQLSNEIISFGEFQDDSIKEFFKYFNEKAQAIWSNFKSQNQKIIKTYNPTNDKLFINEISSLKHLQDYATSKSSVESKNQVYIVNFNSLLSIARKIGKNSQTYIHQQQSLENLLVNEMSKFYHIFIISNPSINQDISHLQKRAEQSPIFNLKNYGTKQACEIGTNNCNNHGQCTQLKEQWSCVCSPSFNKTTSKTTVWVGSDCNKKDVSVPANLFLWTTIALVLLIVGGIQLLASVGSDPLPGVLDAATLSTSKKNI
ncbi:hypothetical protein KGF54_005520 [Candida jiufengensis]|uniref:uncharacterized protein n=1 Tax=Candida jiufengensis TaxID=497108 RepID=UPI002224E66D|nr:uncharacterized protein KGF54_005520 [Candida jiufengensis]KAI5949285.1 hypothetical protein KGF54_005520 [Candida jiufengensis]